MEYHAVIQNNSCRASFSDCLFPPSGISMLLFLWGTILPPLPSVSIVWVGVQEVGIGQREELSCDAVAIKQPQMTPVGSSGAGFILQCCPILRQRGCGSVFIHPSQSLDESWHWEGCDLGLNGFLRAVPRKGLSWQASAATKSWENKCLSPLWGRWVVHHSAHWGGACVSACNPTPLFKGQLYYLFASFKWVSDNDGVQE